MSVNRFVPAAHSYRTVLALLTEHRPSWNASAYLKTDESSNNEQVHLTSIDSPTLSGSASILVWAPGQSVVLASRQAIDQFTLLGQLSAFKLDEQLIFSLLKNTYLIYGHVRPSSELSWRDLLHGREMTRDILINELNAAGLINPEPFLPQTLDEPVAEHWANLPPRVRITFLGVAARWSECKFIVFTQSAVARLNAEAIHNMLAYLRQQYVLLTVWPDQVSDLMASGSGKQRLVVLENRHVVGIGDRNWFERHRETIAALGGETRQRENTDESEAEFEMLMNG